ncbi:transcriptional repressor LexA [Streptomyces sp. NPDC001546]|uniref:transcriptional repressor LexA n=1 Tax=Streptomyces sp. NPDC001546 TaxID=3364585 RepID=UPI00369E6F6A
MHVIESEARPGRPPGVTRPGPDGLTVRQAAIVAFIEQTVARKGYPPSMREIGEGVRLRSTSSVAHQLMALERKGFLYRDPHRPRAYRVRSDQHPDLPAAGMAPEAVQVPLVGRIAAGSPILAEELVEDVLPMPRHLVGEGQLFALTVVGDSMIDAAICDGDIVTVRKADSADHGDIVASTRVNCRAAGSVEDQCSSAAVQWTIQRATGVVVSLDRAKAAGVRRRHGERDAA